MPIKKCSYRKGILLPFSFVLITAMGLINKSDCKKYSYVRNGILSFPELWLDQYLVSDQREWVHTNLTKTQSIFEDDFISKNGSAYVLTEEVLAIFLKCQADYPIEMKFPYPEQIRYPFVHFQTTSQRLSEFNEDLDEPLTKSYVLYTQITLRNIVFFSTTFACQSVKSSVLNSNVHVYRLSHDGIERKGETIQVDVDENQNPTPLQVELPCRPTSPTASISLQKQFHTSIWKDGSFEEAVTWEEIKWNKFDPRKGFTLTLPLTQIYYALPLPSLYVLYKCTLSGNIGSDDEFVLVNVSKKSVTQKESITFKSKHSLKGNAYAGPMSDDENDSGIGFNGWFKCCTGVPSKPPSLLAASCDSELKCDAIKMTSNQIPTELFKTTQLSMSPRRLHFNLSSDCALYVLYGAASVVLCTGENVDISEEYYKLISTQEEITAKSGILSTPSGTPVKHQHYYETLSVAWNSEIQRKVFISVGISFNKITHKPSPKEHIAVLSKHRYFRHQHEDGSSPISKIKSIDIQEVEDATLNIYENEPIYFMCFASSMFFAGGGYVRVNWRNGTKIVLEDADYRSAMIRTKRFYLDSDGGFNQVIGKIIPASREMTSFECFQPVLNASRWEKMELKIQVQSSHVPVFAGSSEEIVYFYVHETGHQITCEILEGTPLPQTITVTKDAKPIKVIVNKINPIQINATTKTISASADKDNIVTINFPPISYDCHGVYQCEAENIKGKAVKTVRVIVSEKSSAFWTVFPICIAMLALILLGLGLWIWIQRRKLLFFQNRQF